MMAFAFSVSSGEECCSTLVKICRKVKALSGRGLLYWHSSNMQMASFGRNLRHGYPRVGQYKTGRLAGHRRQGPGYAPMGENRCLSIPQLGHVIILDHSSPTERFLPGREVSPTPKYTKPLHNKHRDSSSGAS